MSNVLSTLRDLKDLEFLYEKRVQFSYICDTLQISLIKNLDGLRISAFNFLIISLIAHRTF